MVVYRVAIDQSTICKPQSTLLWKIFVLLVFILLVFILLVFILLVVALSAALSAALSSALLIALSVSINIVAIFGYSEGFCFFLPTFLALSTSPSSASFCCRSHIAA